MSCYLDMLISTLDSVVADRICAELSLIVVTEDFLCFQITAKGGAGVLNIKFMTSLLSSQHLNPEFCFDYRQQQCLTYTGCFAIHLSQTKFWIASG